MKNSKIFKTLIVISILLCMVAILFACSPSDIGGGTGTDNGGSGTGNGSGDGGTVDTTITITFMDGEEVLKESTMPKDAIDYVPEKEGFVFAGWYLDEDLTEENEGKPTEDVTLYAKWEVATFTVRFLDGEGQPILVDGKPTQTVEYGKAAIAPEAPEMTGYEFIGWNMEFNSVKSDLTIRALYDTEKMSIILYGEAGDVIKTEKVTVGENISLYYNTMLEYASSALPGGLSLVGLFTDAELENEYQIPSGEHVMPAKDIHLYTKATLQDIEGLKLTPSRNNFRYDLNGLDIASSFVKNNALTYKYEWYEIINENDTLINGQATGTLGVPNKDVGEYEYKLVVTASYKNLAPVTATEDVRITVTLGTLEGLVNVSGFEAEYNGLVRDLDFTGTLPGDVISYKNKNEDVYASVSPVKNAGSYQVISKIERKNYEPIELDAVNVTINTKLLTPKVYMNIRNNGVLQTGFPYYTIEYGMGVPAVVCEFEGFVNGEDETVFDNEYAQSNPYYAGAPVLPDGEYYVPTVVLDNCYEDGSEKPRNYHFGTITPLNPDLTALKIKVLKRALTINLKDVTITYGDDKPVSFESEIINAFTSDVNMIRDGINNAIACDYAKGSPASEEGYVVTSSFTSSSYAVTINSAKVYVNKANVTVTPTSYNVVYGDDVPSYDYVAKGLVNGEDKSVLGNAVYVCRYAKGSDVVVGGGYAIDFNKSDSFKAQGSTNYNITFASGKVTVAPKNVTVTLGDTSIYYGEEAPNDDKFYSLLSAEGIIEGDTIDDVCAANTGFVFNKTSYSPGFDVKEEGYNIPVVFTSSNNYVVNANKGIVGTMMVLKKALTISVVQSEVTYGEAVDLEVKYDGLIGTDSLYPDQAVSGIEVVGGYNVGDGVGEYTISVGNGVSNNYEISYVAGKINVVARKLTIKARAYTDDEIVWSGNLDATDGSIAYVGEGLYEEDAISGSVKTTAGTQGAYVASGTTLGEKFTWDNEISIERAGKSTISNYVITYDFQVAIATYGVFVNANEVVYDGLYHGLDVDHIFETPIATVLFSTDGQEYSEAELTYSQAGNYDVFYAIRVYDANGDIEKEIKEKLTVVINRRPVFFTADAQSITYGEDVPELTYSVSAYEEGKDVYAQGESLATLGELKIEAVDFKLGVGIYDIKISGLENDNYDVRITNNKFTINQAPLTITASSHSITYGDPVPAFSATFDGFVYGETLESIGATCIVSSDYEAVANRKSGEFAIVPSVTLLNYKVTAVNGTLSVAKMNITLTAEDKSVVYGDATPALTAKANKLGYNDNASDLTTIGNIVLSTSYVSRNNVGNYAINVEAISSDKYNITCVAGKVKVSPYETAITWTGVETRVYDGNDYTSGINATYKNLDGENCVASVALLSRNASSTTPNNFKNAATYDATATTADANYKLTGATKALVMSKAKYEDVTHDAFSGVYSSKKTLEGNYALNENYRWATGSATPTVNVVAYTAYYNADSENYEDYELSVSVELTPAIATFNTLAGMTGSVESDFEIAVAISSTNTSTNQTYTLIPTFYCEADAEKVDTYQYEVGYLNDKNTFIGGTYYSVVTFTSVNYKIDSTKTTQNGYNNVTPVNFFIKYRSVSAGGTLYTPEEAINATSSGNIIVKSNANFASQQEVVTKYYNDASYYTVKSGVTLLVPYKADDTAGYLNAGETGSDKYDAHPDNPSHLKFSYANYLDMAYVTLTIPSITTLELNGNLVVGALTGTKKHGNVPQNGISAFGKLVLDGVINANSTQVKVYGYMVGNGSLNVKGTTKVTETMYVHNWPGGSAAAGKYLGDQKVSASTFLSGGTLRVDTPTAFGFSQYEIASVQVRATYYNSASLYCDVKIGTSAQGSGLVKAKVNQAEMAVISPASNAQGLFHVGSTSDSNIIKEYRNGRTIYTCNGATTDGASSLDITVGAKTISLATSQVLFPLDMTDIVVNSGTFTQNYGFKLMPGSTLTVNAGATYNVNNTLVAYPANFVDVGGQYAYPTNRGEAKIIVNGTMNVNGAIGGSVYSGVSGAKLVLASGASTSVTSAEGTGIRLDADVVLGQALSYQFQLQHNDVVQPLKLNGTTSGTAGTTYTYNGTAWA